MRGKAFVASAGEEKAYEMLIERFACPVFNLVSRLMDDSSDAPDVVCKVFRKAFRNMGGLRDEGARRAWIYRIAVREARHRRRWCWWKIGRDRKPNQPRGCGDNLQDPEQPFEATIDPKTQALIEEALSAMNPSLRAALVLREIEGLDYREISEILDVSAGTVKSRVARGRNVLRGHLARHLSPASVLDWSAQLAE